MSSMLQAAWIKLAVMAAVVFGGAATANAAWWTGTYYPSTRTSYYRAQPYYAYYGAAYAPAPAVAAPAVCQTCKPATCGTCVQRVCSYVPQTTYQVAYRDVPVTSYHPVTTLDHCSGCTWTSYRPVTTCTKQAYYIPQTTYRPVCTNVAISSAPVATAYYQAPVVVAPAAPCGGCAAAAVAPAAPATVTPGTYNAPVTTPNSAAPNGSAIPAPQIDPTTPVPNAGGESILQDPQTRAAKPVAPAQPTGNNWKFGGPSNEPTPVQAAPRDRTAMTEGNRETNYTPVSLSTAKIQPAGGSAKVVDANGWEAVK